MGQHGDRVRQSLLDSAEELFATHGIDAVSNRHIAEHAGNANHSAVAYHFGGRDELIRALLERHATETRMRRTELVAVMGESPDLRDLLSCLILPWTDQLASLPRPSWRARLLQQLRSVPSGIELISMMSDPLEDDLIQQTRAFLVDVPPPVLAGRAWIMGRMVTDVCARYELLVEQDSIDPHWTDLAYFIVDAAVGILSAPVTSVGDFLSVRTTAS
jgi:AcrR family transcriptional regulator